MMEKKRRLRINNCFDKLKEILMHSESQQSSKLEKADILEKTIVFVEHLQQKLNQLQQQMNQLLVGTEAGQQFQSGVSIAIAATNDLLAGLQVYY
ncbi:BHLH domain-containing protein [Meloidogyne graminicola]|uniref:BHLH domain-containing protein n=1 Tax=Meloidogyne graminicola TaxID=189291 RepID=A0A8S9ZVY9_9BILA|nr:BHLH domain-containing protein [Meloidogyne graminicola]